MGTEIIKHIEKNITDNVLNKINEFQEAGGLRLPTDYEPSNALKSAWLHLQAVKDKNDQPVLNVCTKESIANSLLDMVVQGLSPAKKQCYFIPYGKQLTLSRSYFGTIAVTLRLKDIKDVFARVIYADDTVNYKIGTDGLMELTAHEQEFKNINLNKIVGAYCVIEREGELKNYTEIMTMDQIKKAWAQGAAKGNSPAHNKFPDEMAKKTVINRACKNFFNVSGDNEILVDAINRTTEAEYKTVDEIDEEINTEIDKVEKPIELDVKKLDPVEKQPEPEDMGKNVDKAVDEMAEKANDDEFPWDK